MFPRTYTTRTDAIYFEIIEPIEASGVIEDAAAEFDIDAIADEVLGDHESKYAPLEDVDFWAVVANYEIAN